MLQNFLWHIQTKTDLTVYLIRKRLNYREYSEHTFVVAYNNKIKGNRPLTHIITMDQMRQEKHSFEEADNKISLRRIYFAINDAETILAVTRHICLFSADGILHQNTSSHNHMNNEKLSIRDSYCRIGAKHAEALIYWNSFKGTDDIGGFVSKLLKCT